MDDLCRPQRHAERRRQLQIASADGLRFVVPVHSVHAGANPRYFGTGRGVTYYNWSSDQFTPPLPNICSSDEVSVPFIRKGLPRALNNAAVAALIAAASAGKTLVDDACAKKAVAELTRD